MLKKPCDHSFVSVNNNWGMSAINGAIVQAHRVVCVYCGHTRDVYSDGRIEIVREEGIVQKNYPKFNEPDQTAGGVA